MTDEEMRIKIAEACGEDNDSIYRDLIPDYLNDLNAMHEAEKVLMTKPNAGELVTTYLELLQDSHPRWITSCFASASQRAEAFLKTLNLWKD